MAKILVIEDDVNLAQTVCAALEFDHHSVELCYRGNDALDKLRVSDYDLVILDLTLPEVGGLDICKTLRHQKKTVPIIMLTGQRTVEQKEAGLDSGADDYLTKPFDLRELSARVRAALRRSSTLVSNILQAKDVVLDPFKHVVTKGGVDVKLRPTEFSMLEFLMRHPNRVFSADQLIEGVWDSESEATVEAIRSCVKRLRRELDDPDCEPGNSIIETVHGVGYKLRSD